MTRCCVFKIIVCCYSNYNRSVEMLSEQYHDTEALSGVWTAVWQLLLAMVIKAVLTIFTFGIKVRERREAGRMCGCVV